MSKLLYVEPTDEITDLVDRIRRAEGERDLVFVVPPDARVLRSALDLQLLMQYTRGFQKRVGLVTADPQVQAMAMRTGFPTFPSVSRMEQGLPLTSVPVAAEAGAVGAAALVGAAAATAVAAPPQASAERSLARRGPSAMVAAPAALGAGAKRWWQEPKARNWSIGVGAGIFVVGLLAVLLLLPTATITVGVQAHRLTDSVTVQGQVGGQSGSVLDVIPVEALLTPTETQTFSISPSGTQVLPPTPATGSLYLCYTYTGHGSSPASATLTFTGTVTPEFSDQSGSGNLGFTSTPGGLNGSYTIQRCQSGQATSSTSSPALPSQADTNSLGTQGNVGSDQQWGWAASNLQSSTCISPTGTNNCLLTDVMNVSLANPSAMSGGQNSTTQTIFSSSDVSSAQTQEQQIAATLTSKVEQALKSLAGSSNVIAQDSSGNGIQITVTGPTLPTVGQAGQQQTLTVSVSAAATAYSPATAKAAVLADLKSKVPSDGSLLANPQTGQIQVVSAGPGGTLTLSSNASGYWAPKVDLSPYRSKVTFMSPGSARTYLLSQLPGASTVVVHQSPFGLPWLPLISGRIKIVRESVTSG
ncbi:MAG: hypothetical protein ACYDC5_11150 [Candidatus Dormibacteria bacterium]